MTTWATTAKSTASWSGLTKNALGTGASISRPVGTSIGLLLVLTRATDETSGDGGIVWTNQTKNTSSYASITKN